MVFSIAFIVILACCGLLGRYLRFLGPSIRLPEVYLAFSLMIFAAGLGSIALGGGEDPLSLFLTMTCGALSMVCFCFGRTPGRELGFVRRSNAAKVTWSWLLWAFAIAVLNVIFANLWLMGLNLFGVEHEVQGAVAALSESSTLERWLWLLYICAIAPVAEEILFRGFFWKALEPLVSKWSLMLITGICFGLIHFDSWTSVPPLCVFGVALGWLRYRSKSMIAPLLGHVFNNILVSVFLMQTLS